MNLVVTIPEDAHCLLKTGQKVGFDTPFLEEKKSDDINLSVAEKLGITPGKILQYTKKFIGEKIEKGDVLAVKSSLFGSQKIVSDYEGIIKEINHYEGKIVISLEKNKKQVKNAFFRGTVADVKKNEIEIKVAASSTFSLKSTTNDFGGEVSTSENLKEGENKILVKEELTPYIYAKASALGVIGYVFMTNENELDLPYAELKNSEDFKKVIHLKYPYCAVNKKYSTITFYRP